MKVFLLGKWGGASRWIEDLADDLTLGGHEIHRFSTRNPKLNRRLERVLLSPLMGSPLAMRLELEVRRMKPDLLICVGAFEPEAERLCRHLFRLQRRPPMIAWVGDRFDRSQAGQAECHDLVAYTDSGLLDLHDQFGFKTARTFLPLAASRASRVKGLPLDDRIRRLCFIAAPTPDRRKTLAGVTEPVDVFGPGWDQEGGLPSHAVVAKRIGGSEVASLYAAHLGVLNLRNAGNVIHGLNQRHFAPYVCDCPVVSDNQGDLAKCLDPGREVIVFEGVDELNDINGRLRRDPAWAIAVATAGRRRVLASHTYAHRLGQMAALVDLAGD